MKLGERGDGYEDKPKHNRLPVILTAAGVGGTALVAILGSVTSSGRDTSVDEFMARSTYATSADYIPKGGLDTQVACDMQEDKTGKFVVKSGNNYFLNPDHAVAYNLDPNGTTNLVGAYQEIYGGEVGRSIGDIDNIELTTKGDDVTITGLGIGSPGEGPSAPVKYDLSGSRHEFGTYGLLEYDIAKFGGRFVVAISCYPAVAEHIATAWNLANASQP